jgi:hypothetical protein
MSVFVGATQMGGAIRLDTLMNEFSTCLQEDYSMQELYTIQRNARWSVFWRKFKLVGHSPKREVLLRIQSNVMKAAGLILLTGFYGPRAGFTM